MKRLGWMIVVISVLGAGLLYRHFTKERAITAPAGETTSVQEQSPAIEGAAPAPRQSTSAQGEAVHPKTGRERELPVARVNLEAAALKKAIDSLVSPETTYAQKQQVWKQLADAGKLDQAITELESRMAADPRSADCPAALGQAYLKKCATLQDVREQGILGMQADKLFDSALSLDSANWEARFMKAVALSYWPPQMNKSGEVIQHFQTLIQQQEQQVAQSHFAETYVWLGNEYQKIGRSDYARLVWERGANLFPGNEGLKGKLASSTDAPAPVANTAVTAGAQ